jgi:hypothetical protein
MTRYRQRLPEIDAVQILVDESQNPYFSENPEWAEDIDLYNWGLSIDVSVSGRRHSVRPGDWIIRLENGRILTCRNEDFMLNYTPITAP